MRTLQWHCLENYDFVWSTSFSCLCIFAVFLYDCLCIAFVDSHNIFLCRQLKLKKVEDWRRRREIWNVQCHLSVLCQSATTQYPAGQWASFLDNSERINTLALDPWRFNFTFTFHTQPYFCQLRNCNSDDKIHVSNKWGLMEI